MIIGKLSVEILRNIAHVTSRTLYLIRNNILRNIPYVTTIMLYHVIILNRHDNIKIFRTTSEAESVPGRHTIIREARIKKKIQKENQTQTSPQATRATSPKSPDTGESSFMTSSFFE